jgi:membrane associated rhomboid family serine protease
MIPLRDDIPSRGRPRVVRFLLLANVVGFLLQLFFGEGFTQQFALKPAYLVAWWQDEPLRVIYESVAGRGRIADAVTIFPGFFDGALPLLTMQFLHGDLLHLGSNLLFLWIFADNVEGEIGSGPFLAFYLSGVLGAYFVRFHHARILTLVPIFVIPLLLEIPALVFLGIWFALQVFRGVTGTGGMVAVWAHAGGFVAGLILVGVFPKVKRSARGPKPRYAIQGRDR